MTPADRRLIDAILTSAETEPDADGWRKHDGGDCPVPYDARVFVRLRCGYLSSAPSSPSAWFWRWEEHPGDIVDYRVVQQEDTHERR